MRGRTGVVAVIAVFGSTALAADMRDDGRAALGLNLAF
jgi:hypothetical protein